MTSKKKTIGVAIGSAFAASMAVTPMANAAENPFALQGMQGGYMIAASHMDAKMPAPEAKCGQGKCGGAAKAGEAKCGMAMMDANKDGKVSRREFMKSHEAMFAAKDKNKNGFIDADEMKAAMESAPAAAAKAGEAKCGQGKCGGAMPKK